MEETLSRGTLIPKDKEFLEKIIAKGPSGLNREEVGIIRARRMYLTSVEKEIFAEVLEIGAAPKGTGKAPVEIKRVEGEVAVAKVKEIKKK